MGTNRLLGSRDSKSFGIVIMGPFTTDIVFIDKCPVIIHVGNILYLLGIPRDPRTNHIRFGVSLRSEKV